MDGLKGIMKRPLEQEMSRTTAFTLAANTDRLHNFDQTQSLTRHEHPADQNLLRNSLAARLTKVFPKDAPARYSADLHARRSSANGASSQTQSQERIVCNANEVFERIRRHQRVKKKVEWSLRKQERLRERLMSWASDTERYLPAVVKDSDDMELSESSSVLRDKIRFDDFPREHGNSVMSGSSYLGMDSVRVVKKDGVFRPVNKYGRSRVKRTADDLPFSNTLLDYQTVAIDSKWASKDQIDQDMSRKKKGLSVSFSAKSESHADNRSDKDSKANSFRSFSCEPSGWRKPEFSKGRSKVEKVGVRWDVPDSRRTYQKHSAPPHTEKFRDSHSSKPSRNLIPVTSGMNKEGTSAGQIRWDVNRPASGRSGNVYNIQGSLQALRKMTERLSKAIPPRKGSLSDTYDPLLCPRC